MRQGKPRTLPLLEDWRRTGFLCLSRLFIIRLQVYNKQSLKKKN